MKSIAIVAVSAGLALLSAGVQAQSMPQPSRNGGQAAPAGPGTTGASVESSTQRMKSDEERRAQRDLKAANRAAVRAATGTTPPAQGTSMGAGPSGNSASSVGSSGTGPAARIPSGTATQ